MPITEKNKDRYPKDWKAIRQKVLERAQNKCEGSPPYPSCRAENHQPHPETGSKVILTIAHLDHTPENCSMENLKAWCQRCHLTFDRFHHAANASKTRAEKKAREKEEKQKGKEKSTSSSESGSETKSGSEKEKKVKKAKNEKEGERMNESEKREKNEKAQKSENGEQPKSGKRKLDEFDGPFFVIKTKKKGKVHWLNSKCAAVLAMGLTVADLQQIEASKAELDNFCKFCFI
eukprot:TRINITY_DN2422_c0_g1_i3.p1 TRINITY_DN2422_c0_g1~~TRINITY_DN2422_c0_g1_i3.p1  ORF type:complete len:233 (-),score=53.02 TRINITY_DN2422_c0_g1_i3:96-794(-)